MLQFNWLTFLTDKLRANSFRRIPSQRKHSRHRRFRTSHASLANYVSESLEDRTLLTTFTVVNTNDSGEGSLREAIEQANANAGADIIKFDYPSLVGQTIVLTDELLISDDLTIDGLGKNRLTIDGNHNSRIFNINNGDLSTTINVTISDIKLTNGYADNGGAIKNNEILSVIDSSINDHQAEISGGAIFNVVGELSIIDSSFYGNNAAQYGGAIYAGSRGSLTINDSIFAGNSARVGGAIQISTNPVISLAPLYSFPPMTVSIIDSDFIQNSATHSGGALSVSGGNFLLPPGQSYLFSAVTVSILDSTFKQNSATYSGGALSFYDKVAHIENSMFSNNTAGRNGGSLFANYGGVAIINSSLTGNSAEFFGGAIYSNHGTLVMENSTLSDNSAQVNGGGIYNSRGWVTFQNSTLSSNSAESNGGGIYSAGALSVFNSTLSSNIAGSSGGAIFQELEKEDTPPYISNRPLVLARGTLGTINSNISTALISTTDFFIADFDILVASDLLTITNSTIVGNTATSSGGGISGLGSKVTPTITNSIVAGNTAEISAQIDVEFTSDASIIQVSIDGLLDPVLRDNGGPTKTHALLSGSAAINTGNNNAALSAELMSDQRGAGHDRIFEGTVDIGAFEYNAHILVVDTFTDEDNGDYSSGNLSLREAIKLANATPDRDSISFDASLAGLTIMLNSELVISNDLTITGLGADLLTIDGNYKSRIFNIDDGSTYSTISVEISGLTLTHGYAENGGAIFNNESLSISNSMLSENEATQNGGGIYHSSQDHYVQNMTVSGTTFYRNVAAGNGGGIYGTLGNTGLSHTVVTPIQDSVDPSKTVYRYSFETTYNFTSISNSHFIENSAQLGGAIFKAHKTLIRDGNNWFIFNEPPQHEIALPKTGFAIVESTFSGNTAEHGGGIFNSRGSMEMRGNSIQNNSATLAGGGIFNAGALLIEESTISENTANDGGGIYNHSGRLRMQNSTISENSALVSGGGIYSGSTEMSFENLELPFIIGRSSVIVTNSTITGNSAEISGGGFADYSNTEENLAITNSIVAGNTAASFFQIIGNFSSNASIIQDSVEGLLDPVLRDNGGPTKTHALVTGSAAINNGNNEAALSAELTNDQRGSGYERIFGETVDIGAFEFQTLIPLVDFEFVTGINKEIENLDIQAIDFEADTLPGPINIDVIPIQTIWNSDITPTTQNDFNHPSQLSLIELFDDNQETNQLDLLSVIDYEFGQEDEVTIDDPLAPEIRKLQSSEEGHQEQDSLSENKIDYFFSSLKYDSNLIAF